MKNFIKSIDVEAWKRILKGPKIPIVAGGTRKKIKEKYANADWKNTFANAKDLNILHCALNVTEYNNVLGYDYSIEVQDKLEMTYKGTNQVKESKSNLLVRDFNLFEMKLGETIAEMST